MSPVIQLRVPGMLVYRDLATRAVSAACKLAYATREGNDPPSSKATMEFSHQVVSAMGEAFNNVVIHGYKGQTPGDVTVEIRTASDRLEIQMSDFGSSFDPSLVPTPNLDELPESGMGIYIMRAFMDVVTYTPGRPNTLLLVKYF